MEIVIVGGLEGARTARGLVVFIDVFRAFTVSAVALAGGARECLLVSTVEEARQWEARIADALISAEEDGLPIPGIPISNSPTQVAETDLSGRVLIQRTTAGTQCVAACGAPHSLAAGFGVARATANVILNRRPDLVTLVATGQPDHFEDQACASYIAEILRGNAAEPDLTLLMASDRYKRLADGRWPGFPASDVELALSLDRFDFAMEVVRDDGCFHLTAAPA